MKNRQDTNNEDREEMLSLDRLVPNAGGSVFLLARLAMLRALEIDSGSRPLVDSIPTDKSTTIALKEIAQGMLVSGGKPVKTEQRVKTELDDVHLSSATEEVYS